MGRASTTAGAPDELERRLGVPDAVVIGLGPGHAHAVAGVVALTAVTYAGVRKSAWLTRAIVTFVPAVLAAVVAVSLTSGAVSVSRPGGGAHASFGGVLQAGGLLFFAFAGYARIATPGEEVRDPWRTIPRALRLALGATVVVYALVTACALMVLGPSRVAEASAPLAETVRSAGVGRLSPVIRTGAAVASPCSPQAPRPTASAACSRAGPPPEPERSRPRPGGDGRRRGRRYTGGRPDSG